MENSLQELRAATMKSLLDAQVNALRVWVREEIGGAERVAREPAVRDAVARLRGELGGQRKVGAYRLERAIGEGGMANVYLARHDLLKRPCALKILKPARASDEMVARFERGVQHASQLCAGLAAAQPVPVELDLLIQACLEKKPENRPQRVAGLIEALDALAAEHRG